MNLASMEFGGSGGITKSDELWNNSTPSSSMGETDIALTKPLDNYTHIKIEYKNGSMIFEKPSYSNEWCTQCMLEKDASSNFYIRRFKVVSSNLIRFGVPYAINYVNSDNTKAIPYKVYGLIMS